MGDAYKGLTIRIGADMTELNRALRSSNSAIHETQKQLRLLEKQAKLDPNNVALYAQKMDVLNDRAQALTSRLATLKSSNFMRYLGEDTEDAALKAKLAAEEYNNVCRQIAELKTEIVKTSGATEETERAFKEAFERMQQGSEKAKDEMRNLGASEEQVAQYAELVSRYWASIENKDLTKQVKDLAKFKTQLAGASSEARQIYEEMARMVTANPAMTQTKQFERFRNEMERAEAAATELRSELSMMDKALDLDPQNIEAARIKMANMQEQVRLNVVQLDRLSEQIDAFKAAGIDKVSAKFPDLKQKIASVEGEVADLSQKLDTAKSRLLELGADTSIDKQSARFKEAERQVAEYEDRLTFAVKSLERLGNAQEYRNITSQHAALSAATTKLTSDMRDANAQSALMRGSMQQLGWSMYSTLTPAMMMFGYSAVNSAETVDAAYRNMRKTVQGTEEQFEALKQEAIDFSRTHVTSADQILEIQAMGGQLGIATENLGAFAEAVSNVEIATNLDADTAAEQMGQLEGILNDMTQNDFASFGDALVRLGNNNATLEDKIMNVMLRIASMGTITGFTTTELLAWSTAVAATGQGAEAAGTAISKTMSDIEAAVGAGGESLQAFASIAQMSSEDFAEAWSTDPSSAMYAFIQGLKQIEANGGSADSTLEGLKITSVRQKQAILGLMQTIDGLNDNLTMSEDAWNGVSDQWGAAGDAAREAERKAEGFSGTIQILRNNVQAFGVEMGESFAWAIGLLGDFVAGATQAYSELPNLAKQMINFGALGAAGLGPMLVATNAVVGAGGDLVRGIKSTKSAWGETVKKAAKYNDALWQQAAAATGVVDANGRAAKSYDTMTKAQKAAALSSSALKTALVGLGAVAVISTIALIVEHFQEADEKATNLRKATEGLNQSMGVTSQSFINAANSINSVNWRRTVQSFGEVRKAIDDATAAQAQMAEEFTSAWAEINGSEYALDTYVATIRDLTDGVDENGNAVKLAADEQAKLAAAVAGYNEIMGTSVTVTDAQNGVLSESTEALVENADAWIRNAEAQAAYEQMVALQKEQKTLVDNLAAAEEQLSIAQGKLNRAEQDGVQNTSALVREVENAQDAVDEATALLDANEKQVEELSEAYLAATDALATLSSALGITEDDFTEFAGILGYKGEEAVSNFAAAIISGDEEVAGAASVIRAASEGMANGNSLEWGRNLVAMFGTGISDNTYKAIEAACAVSGMTEYEFYSSAIEVGKHGEEAIALYAQKIRDGEDPAAAAAAVCAAAAAGELESVDTYSLGADFASGYARGINAKASLITVGNAAASLGSRAYAALKAAQQSNSPSKLTMKLGGDFGEGYALGIEKDAYLAEQEASRMVEQAVRAAQQTIDASGLTMQASVANDLASGVGRASAQSVTNNSTTSTTNSYSIYIDGDLLRSDEAMEGAVYSFLDEMRLLHKMQGGR